MRLPAFVGIDGSLCGAAVVLADDGRTALEVVEWRADPAPALPVVAGDVVALEGVWLGKNPSTFESLLLWRARAVERLPPRLEPRRREKIDDFRLRVLPLDRPALAAEGRVVLVQPQPTAWRMKVLRANPTRDAAKELALAAAREHGRGLPEDLTDHVAEAWCLARYAWGFALGGRARARRRKAA